MLDPTCGDTLGHFGVIHSTASCSSTWPGGTCAGDAVSGTHLQTHTHVRYAGCADLSATWLSGTTQVVLQQTGCSGVSPGASGWSFTVAGNLAKIGSAAMGVISSDATSIVWTNGITYHRRMCATHACATGRFVTLLCRSCFANTDHNVRNSCVGWVPGSIGLAGIPCVADPFGSVCEGVSANCELYY